MIKTINTNRKTNIINFAQVHHSINHTIHHKQTIDGKISNQIMIKQLKITYFIEKTTIDLIIIEKTTIDLIIIEKTLNKKTPINLIFKN